MKGTNKNFPRQISECCWHLPASMKTKAKFSKQFYYAAAI
jgi:hypothetical protein